MRDQKTTPDGLTVVLSVAIILTALAALLTGTWIAIELIAGVRS